MQILWRMDRGVRSASSRAPSCFLCRKGLTTLAVGSGPSPALKEKVGVFLSWVEQLFPEAREGLGRGGVTERPCDLCLAILTSVWEVNGRVEKLKGTIRNLLTAALSLNNVEGEEDVEEGAAGDDLEMDFEYHSSFLVKEEIDIEDNGLWESEREEEEGSGSVETVSTEAKILKPKSPVVLLERLTTDAEEGVGVPNPSVQKPKRTSAIQADKILKTFIKGAPMDDYERDNFGLEFDHADEEGDEPFDAPSDQEEDCDSESELSGSGDAASVRRSRRESSKAKSTTCLTCNLTFKTKKILSQHIKRIHEKILPHPCDFCGKKFFTRFELQVHRGLHQKEVQALSGKNGDKSEEIVIIPGAKKRLRKEAKCPICGQTFKEVKSMRRHVGRVHELTRNYQCDLCERKFFAMYELKSHERLHLPSNKLPCPHCDAALSSQKTLTRHIRRVHKGRRPHACDQCDKTFFTRLEVVKHKASSECELCEGSLYNHIKVDHPSSPGPAPDLLPQGVRLAIIPAQEAGVMEVVASSSTSSTS